MLHFFLGCGDLAEACDIYDGDGCRLRHSVITLKRIVGLSQSKIGDRTGDDCESLVIPGLLPTVGTTISRRMKMGYERDP